MSSNKLKQIPYRICVINGTARVQDKNIIVAKRVARIALKQQQVVSLIGLENFLQPFTAEYTTIENANAKQKRDLLSMKDADMLIFVIPTYHHAIPGALKNFWDMVVCKEAYDKKVIGLVESSNNFDAVCNAEFVLNAIISYYKLDSIVLPYQAIIDFKHIDDERIHAFLLYCITFLTKHFV